MIYPVSLSLSLAFSSAVSVPAILSPLPCSDWNTGLQGRMKTTKLSPALPKKLFLSVACSLLPHLSWVSYCPNRNHVTGTLSDTQNCFHLQLPAIFSPCKQQGNKPVERLEKPSCSPFKPCCIQRSGVKRPRKEKCEEAASLIPPLWSSCLEMQSDHCNELKTSLPGPPGLSQHHDVQCRNRQEEIL